MPCSARLVPNASKNMVFARELRPSSTWLMGHDLGVDVQREARHSLSAQEIDHVHDVAMRGCAVRRNDGAHVAISAMHLTHARAEGLIVDAVSVEEHRAVAGHRHVEDAARGLA